MHKSRPGKIEPGVDEGRIGYVSADSFYAIMIAFLFAKKGGVATPPVLVSGTY